MDIISILHGCLALFLNVYGFVTEKNKWDYYYLLYIYTVAFSWTLFNGDCLITYYYNKQKDPSYQAGNFKAESDLHHILGKEYAPFLKKNHVFIVSILSILSILSMYRVMIRQKFSVLSIFFLFFIYIAYYVTIMNDMDYHLFFCPILLGCLFYIISIWK
jgi:hypothetical protein